MELVYLWVKEYKNIHRQGFNFSPRFDCEFKDEYDDNGKLKDNCELIICDKEKKECEDNNYIENFFGDNINVTAIVGKNGSGKSNIIDLILDSIEDKLITKYIVVFQDSSNVLKYTSNSTIKTNIHKNNDWKSRQNCFVYNNGNHEHYAYRYYSLVEVDKKSIANILAVEYGKPNTSFKISTFMYIPIKIEIKLREFEELIKQSINFFPPQNREEILKIFNPIKDKYHQFLFICYGREKGIHFKKEILQDKEELEKELANTISEKNFNNFFIKLTNEKVFNISKLTEDEKDIYMREDGYFYFFYFDMIDEKKRRFNNLSHGEQMIFGQLLNIYFFSNSKGNLFFLFDEPETALHPNWQRQYLNEIIRLFQTMKKKYQFIFTSHSPFLLSDIPRQNIIFLDKDKIGRCKVVDGLKEKKETFGANIHTLLSDGFFMEDGLMGEFAKNKINTIIEFHQKVQEEHTKEHPYLDSLKQEYETRKIKYWQIQSIIGEDYLKQVIKNHLLDIESILLGPYEAKKEEIKRLREEADRLEKM